jgi:hypothetical protein
VQYKDLDWANGDIVRGSLIVGKHVFREICPTDYGGTGHEIIITLYVHRIA